MPRLSHPRRVVVAAAIAVLLSGCATSAASVPAQHAAATPAAAAAASPAAATPPPAATTPATAATPAPTAAAAASPPRIAALDRVTAMGRRQYTAEVGGRKAKLLLRRVGHDPALLRALQSSDPNATRAYVAREFPIWYHWHISRLRIVQGGRVVVEVGVPFVVAPSQMTLHGAGGRAIGTLQTSIQDEIGFVRLIHRHHPVHVVVRGRTAGHVRSSLPAAAHAQLPPSGPVTIAGRRYQVRSFHETAWNNEPVTIWMLAKQRPRRRRAAQCPSACAPGQQR
jgi:pyruvate/2-oxoglutarate dehydrogenase complex dihydrolipoamide acyltransferase (E2) component